MKRRRVIRALLGWGIFSFAVLQVVEPILHAFHLPDWTLTAVVVVLAGGFVATVILAWIFDLSREGVVRTAPAPGEGRPGSPGRFAGFLLGLGLVAAAPGLVYFFVWPGTGRPAATAQAPGSVSAPSAASAGGTPSIAVLAFADLSPGKDHEYFSDGIAEEILNALAHVKGLRVAGRTSSFHYKGRNEDLHAIGTALGVDNVLEGSVRKQGNRVRITAQLIKASDGFHLWSKNYDGELTDVFELQERIARDVTEELKVVLQGGQGERLVKIATRNPEAYALYLQATAIFNRREGPRFDAAVAQLEEAIRLDPSFARAHSRLAAIHALMPNFSPRDPLVEHATAVRQARRAIELDPTLAEPHAVLGLLLSQERRREEEREAFQRALALDPDDVTANFWLATTLMVEGYRRQGAERLDRVLAIDPMLPNGLMWRGNRFLDQGDLDSAERLVRRASDLGLLFSGLGLSAVAELRGKKDEAAAHMLPPLRAVTRDWPTGTAEVLTAGFFGGDAERKQALAAVDAYLATRPALTSSVASYALIRLGQPDRALVLLGSGPTNNDALVFNMLWGPFARDARRSPEFPEFARRSGLADVWERYGPPDACQRRAPRDYVCE